MLETITSLDQSLFFFFNKSHSPFWDIVMALFTRTEYWILLFLPIIFYIIKNYRTKSLVILLLLALVILVSDQFSGLIKDLVQRLRPTHDPNIQHLVHSVLTKGGKYSFFSSHATNTFAVATFTSMIFRNRKYGVLIFLWALTASYTRIYLGLHYPLDILTGIIAGIFIGFTFYKVLYFTESHFMLFRSPKLSETTLNHKQSRFILVIFTVVVLTTFIVINRLQHFEWI